LLAAADAASGRSWCYAYDGNGNVSAVVDLADGTRVGRYEYDAFGRTIATWGDEELAETNEYRFSTKPLEGAGLYYYGFRYYMPETGRWMSRDPIGERGGGMNLYGFVGNQPTKAWDFMGLVDFEDYNPGFAGIISRSGSLNGGGEEFYPVNYAEGMVGFMYLYFHRGGLGGGPEPNPALRPNTNDRMHLDDSGLIGPLMRVTKDRYWENEIFADIKSDALRYIRSKNIPGKFHGGREQFHATAPWTEGALRSTLQNYSMSWEYSCSVGCSTTSSRPSDSTLSCEMKFEVLDIYDFGMNPGDSLFKLPAEVLGLFGTPYWVLGKWNGTGNGTIQKISSEKFIQYK
jgi:RHS repeat-associated protein